MKLVVLLIEGVFVLEEAKLPSWILGQYTPHEVVTTLHKLLPAFMSGCRCVIGALTPDRKEERVKALSELVAATATASSKALAVVQQQADRKIKSIQNSTKAGKSATQDLSEGIMGLAMRSASARIDRAVVSDIQNRAEILTDADKLKQKENDWWSKFETLRNLAIYLLARYAMSKSVGKGSAAK